MNNLESWFDELGVGRAASADGCLIRECADGFKPTPSLAEIRAHRLFLLEERRRRGLDAIDPDDFAREFRLMSVQRGLKAVGTFSYQTAVSGRGAAYAQFIKPTLQIVHQALEWLGRFPALRKAITERMEKE